MKIKYCISVVLIVSFVLFNCEEDENQVQTVPARDRSEQQLIDLDTLHNYLNTHYYNSGQLNDLSVYPSISDIEISKLNDDEILPDNTTFLIDAVEEMHTTYEDVDYTYYLLKIRNGEGEHPNFTDQVRVNYDGFLTNNVSFDESVTSLDIDLAFSIAGWNRVLPQFKTASQYSINSDGTVNFENYGLGVMFLPSGLSYFNVSQSGIPSYSCLIFKFELQQYKVMDHDNDYIPSYLEDVNGDIEILDDNTDNDQFSNFLDTDDDGDGFSTYREVIAVDFTNTSLEGLEAQMQLLEPLDSDQFFTPLAVAEDGTFSVKLITLEDTNGNGIPNYLDVNDTGTLDN